MSDTDIAFILRNLKILDNEYETEKFSGEKLKVILDENRLEKRTDSSCLNIDPAEFFVTGCNKSLPEQRFYANIGNAHIEGFLKEELSKDYMWFYGTEDEDYRYDCAKCILKITELLGLKNENVVLYGASGGGTTVIGTSKYIKGCSVVAINPQLFFENHPDVKQFEISTGICPYCVGGAETNLAGMITAGGFKRIMKIII